MSNLQRLNWQATAMKILYIEDNYINRLVVQKILQPMGDVKLAVDGPEALKLAGEESFDLF